MRCAALASVFLGLMWPCGATAQQPAASGCVVYTQRCASCHEGILPRMPTRQGLAAMTPEHIESELASFSMRRQGASLSPAERRAVAEFLTGRSADGDVTGAATGRCQTALASNRTAARDWRGWSPAPAWAHWF